MGDHHPSGTHRPDPKSAAADHDSPELMDNAGLDQETKTCTSTNMGDRPSGAHRPDPESAAADRDWSRLPDDVLSEISLKQYLVEDFVIFSAVCRSWRRAATMVRGKWNPRCQPMPWIMITESLSDCKASFYILNKNMSLILRCPEKTDKITEWGSSYGWITMIDKNSYVHLYDPLSRIQLSFPSLETIPDSCSMPASSFSVWRNYQMSETRLSVIKTPEHQHLVVAQFWFLKYLCFARPGDEAWIPVELRNKKVADVTYWDGLLLIIYMDGSVGYCNAMKYRGGRPAVETKGYLPRPHQLRINPISRLYVIESSGNLLMICRHRKEDTALRGGEVQSSLTTWEFEVYMLDLPTRQWKATNLLGDVALFVGETGSMSVSCASETSSCKPNCIYFNDDQCLTWKGMTEYTIGVYNMTDKTVESFYRINRRKSNHCPSWFMPMIR